MLRSSDRRLERVLRCLVATLSILFILLFALIAWRRMHYPFEVDRMESGMLTSVWRLRHGYPLYAAPSLEWAAFLYAPLFFYVSAFATRLVGINYAATRLVSTLATLGSFGLIYALVWSEVKRSAPALFAVGLFASLYPFVLAWYDVGRVDSLSLFFFLAALLATRRSHPALAAFLWLLAFLTKQTFLPLGLAIFLIEWRRPVRMLTGMLSFAVLAGLSVLWLNNVTQHWFGYYAFGTTGVIKWSFHNALMFPFTDLLAPWPIAAALIAAAALFTGLDWRTRDGSYLAITTVLITGAIGYVRAHVGANINAVIPVYAWGSVLAGIALHRLLSLPHSAAALPGRPSQPLAPLPAQLSPHTSMVAAALWLLAAVQLAAHLYRPAEIPTGNLAARALFLNTLRATPGDVWVVDHSFDAILSGKPVHADMDALDAVLGRHYAPALQQFSTLVSNGRLSAVVLDRTPDAYEPTGLFTTPPFTNTFRLQAVAPGGGAPGDRDQPMFVLLPCNSTGSPGTLADGKRGFTNSTACSIP